MSTNENTPKSAAGHRLSAALTGGDARDIELSLAAATFEEPDSNWLYDCCLVAAETGPWDVTAAAATCIGQLARLRNYVRDETEGLLARLAASDHRIRPYAEDALEDVRWAQRKHAKNGPPSV